MYDITGTVNATIEPTPDLYTAYISLKNDVFAGIININVPIANNKVLLVFYIERKIKFSIQ